MEASIRVVEVFGGKIPNVAYAFVRFCVLRIQKHEIIQCMEKVEQLLTV